MPDGPDLPADLMPVTEARLLIPSRQKGCRLDIATLYRWIDKGYLRGWRFKPPGARKGSLFVSRAEVEALLVEVVPRGQRTQANVERSTLNVQRSTFSEEPAYRTAREANAALRRSDAVLDAAGI